MTKLKVTMDEAFAALEAAGFRVWECSRTGERRLYDPRRSNGYCYLEQGYSHSGKGIEEYPSVQSAHASGAHYAHCAQAYEAYVSERLDAAGMEA